jgi:endonuclease YncB( thermonuclease family)
MRKANKVLSFLLVFCLFFLFVGCNNSETPQDVDYLSMVSFEGDPTGKTFDKDGIEKVTLYQAVDGDTIHVYGKNGNIMKLRFYGVDTPESTAAVEAWGVAASAYTKNIVKKANSLIITSNGGPGEYDSYGRCLSWVWYQMNEGEDYVLLNLELVQEGYSKSKNTVGMLYYDIFVDCANQTRQKGIKVWGEKDPNYSYSGVKEVSLPELKRDINEKGMESEYYLEKVVFEAVVARYSGTTYYLVETDYSEYVPEPTTYGIQVFHRNSTGLLEKNIGSRVRISGTITYYETGDVFQLTDVVDRLLTSNINNLKVVEEGTIEPTPIIPSDLNVKNKELEFNLVSINNLLVTDTYTTRTEGSSSFGAITLTCKVGNETVTVRTEVIYDFTGDYATDSNNIILASNFEGKTLDVVGVVEKYENNYQVKLLSLADVVIR